MSETKRQWRAEDVADDGCGDWYLHDGDYPLPHILTNLDAADYLNALEACAEALERWYEEGAEQRRYDALAALKEARGEA